MMISNTRPATVNTSNVSIEGISKIDTGISIRSCYIVLNLYI